MKPAESPSPPPRPADAAPARQEPRSQARRLATLVLFAVVVLLGAWHFLAIADSPVFSVHSDDVIWMYRFVHWPRPVDPADRYDYVHGIDQGALERWVFGALLRVTGRMPEKPLPPEWDYKQSFEWNVAAGRVAPPDAARLVRIANALFMTAAAALIFLALARAAGSVAGFFGGIFFIVNGAAVEVLWSLGSDPLFWALTALSVYLWARLGDSLKAAIVVGLVAGLATSAKVNAGAVVAAFCLWLLLKRQWRRALIAGATALGVFVLTNPILFSKGVFGVPAVMLEMARWRAARAAGVAANYPAYAHAPQAARALMLLAWWWLAAIPLFLAPALRRLEPIPFWAAVMLVVHGLTVTVPVARYVYPMYVALAMGLLAAWWPTVVEGLRALKQRLAGGRREAG